MVKIYESPDGGETVYERDTDTGTRVLVCEPHCPEWHIDNYEFIEMQEMANEGNRTLQKMFKQIKTVYDLSKENDSTN